MRAIVLTVRVRAAAVEVVLVAVGMRWRRGILIVRTETGTRVVLLLLEVVVNLPRAWTWSWSLLRGMSHTCGWQRVGWVGLGWVVGCSDGWDGKTNAFCVFNWIADAIADANVVTYLSATAGTFDVLIVDVDLVA